MEVDRKGRRDRDRTLSENLRASLLKQRHKDVVMGSGFVLCLTREYCCSCGSSCSWLSRMMEPLSLRSRYSFELSYALPTD